MSWRSASGSRSALVALVIGLAMPSAVFAVADDDRSARTSVAPAIELPTLPVATPTLPPLPVATPTLPPLPVATPTLPTLPVATPTLPVATPTLPVATPTLPPVPPSGLPAAGASGAPAAAIPALAQGGPAPSGPPGAAPEVVPPSTESPFQGFVLPGLLLGIPALALILILGIQLVGGAAWLPVIRRWVNGEIAPWGDGR